MSSSAFSLDPPAGEAGLLAVREEYAMYDIAPGVNLQSYDPKRIVFPYSLRASFVF